MTRRVSLLTAIAGLLLLASACVAQDPFREVPSTSWAYGAIADLQQANVLIGYPDGFFNARRTLTRYEFALAIKRAVDKVVPPTTNLPPPGGHSIVPVLSTAPTLTSSQVRTLRKLIDEFEKDLIGLKVNVAQVKSSLDAARPTDPISHVFSPEAGVTGATSLLAPDSSIKTGLRAELPVFNSASLATTLVDFTTLPGGVGGDTLLSGINLSLHPVGRVVFSGAASRSMSLFEPYRLDGTPTTDADNNAFDLNFKYNSGPVGVKGGFQYVDPGYEAPGSLNRLGIWSYPTNVLGPYVRVNYNLDQRMQFQFGTDLLEGAHNRSYSFGSGITTGFGPHDYMGTLSAGMQYRLWGLTSLTADWEGVYWDLSSASAGMGSDAHPFESYINLGTGINLHGNAMLKFGYQIGTFGNLSGLGGSGSPSSGQGYNAFTTQLNVKF